MMLKGIIDINNVDEYLTFHKDEFTLLRVIMGDGRIFGLVGDELKEFTDDSIWYREFYITKKGKTKLCFRKRSNWNECYRFDYDDFWKTWCIVKEKEGN